MAEQQQQAHDVFQVVMNDALLGPFRQWLATRGLEVRRIACLPGDLPTFIVGPTDETLRAA